MTAPCTSNSFCVYPVKISKKLWPPFQVCIRCFIFKLNSCKGYNFWHIVNIDILEWNRYSTFKNLPRESKHHHDLIPMVQRTHKQAIFCFFNIWKFFSPWNCIPISLLLENFILTWYIFLCLKVFHPIIFLFNKNMSIHWKFKILKFFFFADTALC